MVRLGRVGGDEDGAVVEGAVGDEHAEVDIVLQHRAEAKYEGDGAAGRLAQTTSRHAPPLPRKPRAQARVQGRRDQVRSSAHRQDHRRRQR